MIPISARKARYLVATSLLALVASTALLAQSTDPQAAGRASLNLYGVSGLIDMPSGEMQPDAYLTSSYSQFGAISRTTLTFQISPRMSASFRYYGIADWNRNLPCNDTGTCTGVNSFETYYDRSFDFRFLVLKESQYLPSVVVGLQDIAGTGILSGEYIAATKHITPEFKATVGLGWGRLGSYGSIGSIGDRPDIQVGQGGDFNFDQWFRGPVAPFAGVEWRPTEKLTFKAEYSSDDFEVEADRRQVFDRRSPFNFGAEYKINEWFQVGGYYMYGSELGFAAHFTMNPKQRPMGGIRDGAPEPVEIRPSRASDPDSYDQGWTTQPDAGQLMMSSLNKRLAPDGIVVEGIRYDGTTARVTVRNTRYDAESQVVGRTARAMSHIIPNSVNTFEIVPVSDGIPVSRIVVDRATLERNETAPDAAEAMRQGVTVAEAGPLRGSGMQMNSELYPRFRWSLAPYMQVQLFDPNDPFLADFGARLSARYDVAPGFVLSGAITQPLFGNLDKNAEPSTSELQHVRSDSSLYSEEGNPAIEHLTAAWYAHPTSTIHTRVTVGMLERMFGGISAEVLWKRVDSPFALGAEVNYVKQRDYDQLFTFQDYSVVTGHVSGYYLFDGGYHAQLDVGRYLAGDVGATLSLNREFENGWKVGVFATKTDASAEEFGEGSFDKGITLNIPLNWGLGTPSRSEYAATIRPVARDGGARLDVADRLYDSVRAYDESSIDAQWGRFWK